MCESGEHARMAEEAYRGHAYTESQSTEDLDGFDRSTIRTLYKLKACHFCGFEMKRRKHGFLLT